MEDAMDHAEPLAGSVEHHAHLSNIRHVRGKDEHLGSRGLKLLDFAYPLGYAVFRVMGGKPR